MLGLKLLIIDTPWTAITEASIRQNWPDKDYEITTGDMATIISNALHCAEGEITMVVRGGVVLEINAGDLPPLSKLKNYHLCAARSQVYSDHPSLSRFYDYTETNRNKGHFDLSVFIINPAMWGDVPEKTRGILRDKKILCMPR